MIDVRSTTICILATKSALPAQPGADHGLGVEGKSLVLTHDRGVEISLALVQICATAVPHVERTRGRLLVACLLKSNRGYVFLLARFVVRTQMRLYVALMLLTSGLAPLSEHVSSVLDKHNVSASYGKPSCGRGVCGLS